jgi:predicted TIM-barrel fold metal-dependent hydrolase
MLSSPLHPPPPPPSRSVRRRLLGALGALAAGPLLPGARASTPAADPMPLFDAHVHYSHDAWQTVPPPQAVAILRQAGLQGVLVSSSDDEGTQKLLAAAPDLIVPELRPYRRRADMNTWVRDDGVARYLEERLAKHRYVGIGEFHLFGADAELPVPRRMVALARERGLLLHAHSDADAVNRLFAQWPEARVLWAHSGFERPEGVREQLRRHPRLWCDLAFRGDQARDGKVDPAWREAFEEFPQRFMVGTDTFTPERWHYIGPHADWTRQWLADLPRPLAERLAWRNGDALLRGGRRSA